jgi:hypothetical protein
VCKAQLALDAFYKPCSALLQHWNINSLLEIGHREPLQGGSATAVMFVAKLGDEASAEHPWRTVPLDLFQLLVVAVYCILVRLMWNWATNDPAAATQ